MSVVMDRHDGDASRFSKFSSHSQARKMASIRKTPSTTLERVLGTARRRSTMLASSISSSFVHLRASYNGRSRRATTRPPPRDAQAKRDKQKGHDSAIWGVPQAEDQESVPELGKRRSVGCHMLDKTGHTGTKK